MPHPSVTPLLVLVLVLGCSKTNARTGNGAYAAPSPPAVASPTSVIPAATVRYSARGVVRSVDDEKSLLWIAHEDIPGYMKAMTMPFVASPALRRNLHSNDHVEFSFHDDGSGNLVIDTLSKRP